MLKLSHLLIFVRDCLLLLGDRISHMGLGFSSLSCELQLTHSDAIFTEQEKQSMLACWHTCVITYLGNGVHSHSINNPGWEDSILKITMWCLIRDEKKNNFIWFKSTSPTPTWSLALALFTHSHISYSIIHHLPTVTDKHVSQSSSCCYIMH